MSPCTAKLSAYKSKHFMKWVYLYLGFKGIELMVVWVGRNHSSLFLRRWRHRRRRLRLGTRKGRWRGMGAFRRLGLCGVREGGGDTILVCACIAKHQAERL